MQSSIISTAILEGSYAIAAINSHTPHTIYTSCKGSPIILGMGRCKLYFVEGFSIIDPLSTLYQWMMVNLRNQLDKY